jgi:hypothetical protein
MFGLVTRLLQRPKFTEAWCVGCRQRQRVRQVDIVDAVNSKSAGHRLLGICQACGGKTSTFVRSQVA